MALWGLTAPALQGLMTERLNASDQGKLQGANNSMMGIAGMIGPLLFTHVFAVAIRPGQAWHLPGAPMLLAALMMAFALALAWRVAHKMLAASVPLTAPEVVSAAL